MRGPRSAALAAVGLGVLAVACGDRNHGAGGALPLEAGVEAGAPALSVYGLGDVVRSVPHACPGPRHDEFDFWVGKWDVHNTEDALIATSVITSEMDDCLVMEDFIDNSGYQGKSINAYDRNTGTWQETFVDNLLGQSFRLAGGLQGAEMVMSGSQPTFNFATQAVRRRDVRVVWTPLSGGRVRQRFETTFDGVPNPAAFDGTYIPRRELDRATPTAFVFCQTLFAEFRQLDFWLGGWTVSAESGGELGTSRVRSDLNDCLIQEDFETPKGYRSRSYLYFDFVVERWFRTFADNTGMHLELSGNLEGDAMVMTGEEVGSQGQVRPVQVTITPDGPRVRQTWEDLAPEARSRKAFTLVYAP